MTGCINPAMRRTHLVALSIAAGFGPLSAQAGGVWQTDPKSACSVWDAAPVPDETIGWAGSCRDGRASGPGVLTIFRAGKQVERSEGEFVDGKQSGHGSRDYPNGRYVGTFKDGLFEGEGSFVGSDGMDYTYRSADGTVYTGHWNHGCFRHGGLMKHLGVPAEDCGLAEGPSASIAAAPSEREDREN